MSDTSLLLVSAATMVLTCRAAPLISDAFALRIRENISHHISSTITANYPEPLISVKLHYPTPELRKTVLSYWGDCGGRRAAIYNFERRATKLPVDPTLVLAAGYLKCEMIKVALLEPRVPVAFYPVGYFGDFEYEGVLVSDWFEFTDETVLRRLFGLMVATTEEPDEEETEFDQRENVDLKLTDQRMNIGFVPELLFEFVGETTVRVEINLTTERLLIQTGDRWDFYSLDWRNAEALKNMVKTGQNKPRQTGA